MHDGLHFCDPPRRAASPISSLLFGSSLPHGPSGLELAQSLLLKRRKIPRLLFAAWLHRGHSYLYMKGTGFLGQYLAFPETYRLIPEEYLTYEEYFFKMYGVGSVIFAAIFLPLLGSVAVFLRFYTRRRLTNTFIGIDDWLIAFSCLLVLGQGAAQIVGGIPNLLVQKGMRQSGKIFLTCI